MCGSVGASRAGNPEEGGSSWGQSVFVGGNVRLGYVRLRGKRLESCNIVFFKYKEKIKKK